MTEKIDTVQTRENLIKEKKRNSNFELLRIFSMIGIVLIHYFRYGVEIDDNIITVNRIIYELFCFVGRFGVICFVMITGYFMVDKKIKIRNIVKLILEVVFYSIISGIILVIIGVDTINTKTIIFTLFPITFRRYWFISVYITMYLLIPFINILIKDLNNKKILILIIILMSVF